MKKAIDQTVRELKREVNKKVLKVPGIEQKILDATSNEPWGPHGSILADIAQATQNYHDYQIIINVIWKRINDTGKNWRHVYKALSVLEYLLAHGSERVFDDTREHAYQIATLSDFNYIDSAGRDQGNNVRRKSQTLVALLNDKDRIKELRDKALANRDKFRATFSTAASYRPTSYGTSGGGYGDRYDDQGSYSNRDGDRNGYGRERDWGYRDDDRYGPTGDSYNRDGDRNGRDADEQYGRDTYPDNDYRQGRGSYDELGSRNRNYDRDRTSFDEHDRYSSRSAGGRADDTFQGERQFERNFSDQNVRAPPSYEESTTEAHNNVQGGRNRGTVAAQAPEASPPPASKVDPHQSENQGPKNVVNDVPPSGHNIQTSHFDDFDPRDSLSAAPLAANLYKMDYSGTLISDPANSLALVPVGYSSSYTEADMPTNSGYGTSFVAPSSSSTGVNQPSEDPFGESPFKATQESISAQQHNFATGTLFQTTSGLSAGASPSAPVPPKMETSSSFDFEDTLRGLTSTNGYGQQASATSYTPNANGQQLSANHYVANVQQPSANTALLSSNLPAAEASNVLNTGHPHTGSTALASSQEMQPAAQRNLQTAPMNLVQQPGFSALKMPAELTSKAHPSKDKFELKSTIWADTLNRGLVNLNISGNKINPLADIGIDFDSLNRREKRNEMGKSSATSLTSTTSMGKAMGAGSSMGRVGAASGMTPPPKHTGTSNGTRMGAGMGMNTQGARSSGPGMPSGGGGTFQRRGTCMMKQKRRP